MSRRVLLVGIALLSTWGAAGAQRVAHAHGRIPSYVRHGWIAADADPMHPWLYVTGNESNDVGIYDLKRAGFPKIGSISQGVSSPADVAVDGHGTVYVANETGTVTVYPAGSVSPSVTISQGLESPQGVAVDASGNVYVANRGPSPSIQVYGAGQTTPLETITSSLIQVPTQLAFDARGNLFVGDNATVAYELPAGSQTVQSLGWQYVTSGGGMAIDPANGDLFVSGVASTLHSFWGFKRRGTSPKFSFDGGAAADSLAVGAIHRRAVVFVPDSSSNNVYVYRKKLKDPIATLATGLSYVVGVAYKAAGIP
jgi:hypothetical protein